MYDSITGRFCSRDPIGYFDGASLYNNYFGLSLVDPTGLETIGFEFNAFIGKGRGERPGAGMWWLREPGHIGVRVPEFSSDARGFGQVGTSRLFTTGSVESCAIGFQTPHASNNVGESHRRTPNGYMWVFENGRRRIVYLWKYHSKTAPLDVDEVDGSFSRMPCKSEVTFRASAGYPFVMGSPNIDYEITFTFTVVGSDRVQVDVSGWHDQFPDYEAILKVGGRRSVIYKRRSPDMGPGILNLNSTTGASGSTVISVKTPACCPGTCGS
jgi:hypothetical protein